MVKTELMITSITAITPLRARACVCVCVCVVKQMCRSAWGGCVGGKEGRRERKIEVEKERCVRETVED